MNNTKLIILLTAAAFIVLFYYKSSLHNTYVKIFYKKELAQYSFLSDDTIASQSFQLKHLIKEHIVSFSKDPSGEYILFDRNSQNCFVRTQRRNATTQSWDNYYWKINKNGYLVDSLITDRAIELRHDDGYLLHPEGNYFIDWMLTGDKQEKQVTSTVNSNLLMTQSEVDTTFDQLAREGELVTIRRKTTYSDMDKEPIKSYFMINGNMTLFLSKGNHTRICDIWTDRYGLIRDKSASRIIPIENEYYNNYMESKHFIIVSKSPYRLNFNPTGKGYTGGYYGVSYIDLKYKNEVLKLKNDAFKEFEMVFPGAVPHPELELFVSPDYNEKQDGLFFILNNKPQIYNYEINSDVKNQIELGLYVIQNRAE